MMPTEASTDERLLSAAVEPWRVAWEAWFREQPESVWVTGFTVRVARARAIELSQRAGHACYEAALVAATTKDFLVVPPEGEEDTRLLRDADIDAIVVASRTEEMIPSSMLRAMAMRVRAARDERDAKAGRLVALEADACPVCWTRSWEPTEDGLRCLCCWQAARLVAVEAERDRLKVKITRYEERISRLEDGRSEALRALGDPRFEPRAIQGWGDGSDID